MGPARLFRSVDFGVRPKSYDGYAVAPAPVARDSLTRCSYFGEKEVGDGIGQAGDRVGTVDSRPQMRAVLESFGVPGPQSAEFVDHPPVVARGWRLIADAF